MSDFDRAIAALRGLPPPPAKLRVRPSDLPDPTDVREQRVSRRSEADVCDRLGEWLRADGWEVFFEVPLGSWRPDVVAFKERETLAIEAKLLDVDGVIQQGLRVAKSVDRPYVALPFGAADVVVLALARYERDQIRAGHRPACMPGVLGVGTDVIELRHPLGRPTKRLATDKLRERAERFGTERGGIPSTDQTERNVELWRKRIIAKASVATLAEEYKLSPTGVRTAIGRITAWREHLRTCSGYPCAERALDREFFAGAHKHTMALASLPDPE
jgi:hypothetical protein